MENCDELFRLDKSEQTRLIRYLTHTEQIDQFLCTILGIKTYISEMPVQQLERSQVIFIVGQIRSKLNLPPEVQDISDIDLIKCFTVTGSEHLLPAEVRLDLRNKWGAVNMDRFEYIGDSVLELVAATIILDVDDKYHVYDITKGLVRNSTLFCKMSEKKLCDMLIIDETIQPKNVKMCADALEAIIGCMYIHLMNKNVNSIKIITKWLYNHMNFKKTLDEFIKTGRTLCVVDGVNINQEIVKLKYTPSKDFKTIRNQIQQNLQEDLKKEVELEFDKKYSENLSRLRHQVEEERRILKLRQEEMRQQQESILKNVQQQLENERIELEKKLKQEHLELLAKMREDAERERERAQQLTTISEQQRRAIIEEEKVKFRNQQKQDPVMIINDFVTRLRPRPKVEYKTFNPSKDTFETVMIYNGKVLAVGTGSTVPESKKNAAKIALPKLGLSVNH